MQRIENCSVEFFIRNERDKFKKGEPQISILVEVPALKTCGY
jgi:hypothetical protein